MNFDPDQVYHPAEDTFLLLDAALAEVQPCDEVIEIGTGSGEVAAAVQKIAEKTVAVDINPHAVAYATEINHVNAVRSDLFSAISGLFDLILFNAPYLPTSAELRINDWLEYALDGGRDGREIIRRFLPQAVSHLKPFGRILLLISSLTGFDEVRSLARELGCIVLVVREEIEDDGEKLYLLRISRDICSMHA
ncbi:MAG TPA: methyltransferase [Methanocorpusculum sp.]|nr:methyltransferase [Methanocorpusculum sp.]